MIVPAQEKPFRRDQYKLAGLVELDDDFFGAPAEGGKRGRGTEQTPVLVGGSLNQQGAPQYVNRWQDGTKKRELIFFQLQKQKNLPF